MSHHPAATPLSRPRQLATIVIVCLANAMLGLDTAVVNMALPFMARDLHSALSGVQWAVDAYTIALAAVVLTAGSIADRRGRRRLFIIGMVVFTASSLACALAQTIVVLHSSWAVLLPGLIIACAGTGVVNPAQAMLALSSGPPQDSGLLAGAANTFRSGGIAVGVAAFGALLPARAALGHGSAASYVSGLHHALEIGSGLCLLGAVVVATLIGRRPATVVRAGVSPVAAAVRS